MADRFRRLERDHFDVIVVGAGTGGLTAAGLLAERGKRVLVVDGHYVAGGNGTVFRRKGYEFDIGLHYIGGCDPAGMIPRVLRAAGAGEVEFEELDPDGYDTLVFPDLTFRMPKGEEALRARLLETFPAERAGIDRYLRVVSGLGHLQRAAGSPLAMLRALPRSLLAVRYMGATFEKLLDSCTADPRLRAVLAGQSGDYGQPPSRAAALMAVGLTHHYLDGAYFPKGGGQVLSDRLAAGIEANGGKILLRAPARRILVEGGRVTGVELDSHHLGRRVVRAPVVISNADYKRTVSELVGAQHFSKKLVSRVERAEMSPAFGVLYLGLARDLKAERHPRTNYWIYPSYDIEGEYAATARGEVRPEPFAYISIASVKDPTNRRAAPPGVTNMQVMSLAPSSPAAWGVTEAEIASGAYSANPVYLEKKRAFTEAMLRTASRVFPDIENQIAYQEVATPLTHRRFTGSTDGTSYGLAHTPAQFLRGRPGSATEIPGLYLAGASCRTGHGIAGVMMSGVAATAAILGRRVWGEVFGKGNAGPSVAKAAAAIPIQETDEGELGLDSPVA